MRLHVRQTRTIRAGVAASHRRRTAFAVAVLASLGLLAAGCGGGAPSAGVANLGTSTTTSTTSGGDTSAGGSGPQTAGGGPSGGGARFAIAGGSVQQMTKFAACMRSHGVANFPDPNAQGVISGSIDPGSAQFQQAQQACRQDLPNGGVPTPTQQAQARQNALAFSACMRKNGLPNFPDPQFGPGGRVSIRIGSSSGIDPRSPQFQQAQKACQKDLPGKLGQAGTKP
jgi:hypothetical protein